MPFLETVAMGAGSVEASGERMDAMSSPMDDANRNPSRIVMGRTALLLINLGI